jgi:hypothetical protein
MPAAQANLGAVPVPGPRTTAVIRGNFRKAGRAPVPAYRPALKGEGTELHQLIGKRRVKGQIQWLKQPIDQVFYNGGLVGHIARHDNAAVCFSSFLPETDVMAVCEACVKLRAENGAGTLNGEYIMVPDPTRMPGYGAEVLSEAELAEIMANQDLDEDPIEDTPAEEEEDAS